MSHNKLRGRIVEKYGSIKRFSEVLSKTQQMTNLKVQGKAGFSRDDIVLWSKLLEIPKAEYYDYFIE